MGWLHDFDVYSEHCCRKRHAASVDSRHRSASGSCMGCWQGQSERPWRQARNAGRRFRKRRFPRECGTCAQLLFRALTSCDFHCCLASLHGHVWTLSCRVTHSKTIMLECRMGVLPASCPIVTCTSEERCGSILSFFRTSAVSLVCS